MSEFVGQVPDKEGISASPLLRDVLVDSMFREGRPVASSVTSIDLGVFAEEATRIANFCFNDDQNSNVGKLVYVTGQKKVLIPENYFQATNGGFLMLPVSESEVPKQVAFQEGLNERYCAMIMHSNANTDIPTSETGLALLSKNDTESCAISAVLVVGRTTNSLVLRGENTPIWTPKQQAEKLKTWREAATKVFEKHYKPGMSTEKVSDLGVQINTLFLRRICKEYDFAYFMGETGSTIVTRQPVQD